ncbi:30S ribosomal protein S2 [Candidatus Pacearchaeota archaeon]|nr:30S ribosomal protein S2 [Candidatus Pacearchaeota archaeon]
MVKSKEDKPLEKVSKIKEGKTKAKEKAGKLEESEDNLKKRTSDRSVLLKEIKEKAKKLQEKIEGVDTKVIKEELDKKRQLLIPLEDYVKTGIHLGTRVITPDMKKFVYRRRADSIGVLNTSLIDEHIKRAIDFMSKYSPEEVVLICKRESGWQAAVLFSKATGIKVFTKKYPAGMMTNTQLEAFYEPELVIVTDPWVDRNSLNDALKTGKKILMLADTNNFIKKADHIIPCNNKGGKSLGLVYYLLAKGYIEKRKLSDDSLESMNSFIAYDGQEE